MGNQRFHFRSISSKFSLANDTLLFCKRTKPSTTIGYEQSNRQELTGVPPVLRMGLTLQSCVMLALQMPTRLLTKRIALFHFTKATYIPYQTLLHQANRLLEVPTCSSI